MRRARAFLAVCALAAATRAAQAGGPPPAPKTPPAVITGLREVLRGPDVFPGSEVLTDEAGRMRTRELDDLVSLRLRLSIPF